MKSIVILFLFLLSSCVGISVVTEKQKTISSEGFRIQDGRINYLDIKAYRAVSGIAHPASKKYSKEDVVILWGEPDKIVKDIDVLKNSDVEYWYYKREMGFSGVVVGAIIPIPLMIPTGYRNTILVFEDDKLQSINVKRGGHSYGFICFLILCTNNKVDVWNLEYGS